MKAADIVKLKEEALAEGQVAKTPAELEAVRIKYLGRNGLLPEIMKGLKDGLGGDEIHVRHPKGQDSVPVFFPLCAVASLSVFQGIEIVVHRISLKFPNAMNRKKIAAYVQILCYPPRVKE